MQNNKKNNAAFEVLELLGQQLDSMSLQDKIDLAELLFSNGSICHNSNNQVVIYTGVYKDVNGSLHEG